MHGCRSTSWRTGSLLGASSLKKTDFSFPVSHQLPLWVLPRICAGIWLSLIWLVQASYRQLLWVHMCNSPIISGKATVSLQTSTVSGLCKLPTPLLAMIPESWRDEVWCRGPTLELCNLHSPVLCTLDTCRSLYQSPSTARSFSDEG